MVVGYFLLRWSSFLENSFSTCFAYLGEYLIRKNLE